MICRSNKLLAILEAADEMNMMKKALPICKEQRGSAFPIAKYIFEKGEIHMAVFRVEKTRNYTVMSNHHLRDKSLSLKAKGLLSLMLSLPEDWDYTTKGLARICKDGVDSICATVRELEGAGYIVRARERHADGTLGGIEYTILEQPREPEPPKRENPVQAENTGDAPKLDFPEQVKPEQENPAQLNKEEKSKEELSTDVMDSFPSFPHEGKTTQENGMEQRETY